MAKPSYETLVNNLVDIYAGDDASDTAYLWQVYNDTRAEYDRKAPVVVEWAWYLRTPTTDANIYNHTRDVLRLFFTAHGYDWLLEQYKLAKKK